MALPNGDLITTPFDPQMAYPSDRRMQVDTLNSRDSISMFIRWEGMPVYVLENSKIYILQGGRSNEFWKELGTGSGTGGTTFVGQFPTADLLPTSGRSAGDYAFVGTGDDFVQYNWDNIGNQWVMAEGQTDMASEFFHIGYKTPLRRPVIFPLFPKDVLVQESGDFVFAPETAVARFIFVGEVDAIRGIETAASDREIKLVNRTGSDIILRDKASGIPTGSGFDFGGTDYTWVNGSEITLKGGGTYWQLAPNNQIAFSDHLDSVNAQVSVGSDGLEVITGVNDQFTGETVSFKEINEVPTILDGIINIQKGSKYYKRVLKEYNLGEFNILPENTSSLNALNFNFSQTVIEHDCKHILPTGIYNIDDIEIIKSGVYDFSGVTLINDSEVAGTAAIRVLPSADFVQIIGLKQEYQGIFYTTNPDYTNPQKGVNKDGIRAENKKTILTKCRVSWFSSRGYYAANNNGAFYLDNCTSNNNGYSGCWSEAKDFQVFGGEYSENGGASFPLTGYGIVANMYNGNAKIIGVTSERNLTNNIDSHVGSDLIISSNNTADPAIPIPQWFNKVNPLGGGNIAVSQRINKCIISDNICKRGDFGISVHAGLTGDFLKNVKISDNILEDNRYQLRVRQLETDTLTISGNIEIDNGSLINPVERGLVIDPVSDSQDRAYIQTLKLSGNTWKNQSAITLSNNPDPTRKNSIEILNDTFSSRLDIFALNNKVDIRVGSSNLYVIFVSGGTSDSVFEFTSGNIIDVKGENINFNIHQNFNGFIKNEGNIFKNSTSSTQLQVPSNSVCKNNTIIINHQVTTNSNSFVIRSTGSNYEISSNDIVFNGVNIFERVFRFTAVNSAIIKDNNFKGLTRIDYGSGNITANKLTWDTANNVYDFGLSSIPSLGDFVFPNGSIIKNNTGDVNRPSEWIVFNGVFIPRGFSKKGVREQTATNVTITAFAADYYNNYINGGTFTVNPFQVPIGETVEGVVTGESKTFIEGSGFTIIRPTGSSLTVNQNESFSLKFISDTQAVLTIFKSIPDIPVILSATATLDFPIIAAGESAQLTTTVTGAEELDPVEVGAPAAIYNSNGADVKGFVSGPDTVTIRIRNNGASSIDPGESDFKIKVFK